MDVVLVVLRDVVVHDKRKVVYLESACGDIGCNKQCGLAALELVQGLLPLGLREVSCEVVGIVAVVPEPCAELLGHVPAVGEHECRLRILGSQKLQQEHELLGLCHMVELLCDALDRDLVRFQIDLGGLVHELPCELSDPHLKRCGEQQRLPDVLAGQVAEHLLDIGIESHVEHPVSLVDDERVYALGIELAVLHELEEASGCADVDVATHLEELPLVFVAHSAVEDADVEALDLGAEEHGVLRYLLCQFPGGSDYQARGADSLLLVPEVFLKECDDVDSGLPASRLGLDHYVRAFDADRQDLLLHRHACFETSSFRAFKHLLMQIQFTEQHNSVFPIPNRSTSGSRGVWSLWPGLCSRPPPSARSGWPPCCNLCRACAAGRMRRPHPCR